MDPASLHSIIALLTPPQGLGELYEDDFVKAAVGGSAPDKDEKIRQEAKAVFQVRPRCSGTWKC